MSKIKFMDGDGMKRRGHKSFWGQKQILIAGAVMLIAAAAMTFVYVANSAKDNKEEIAKVEETEKQEKKVQVAKKEDEKKETKEPAKSVTKVVKPKEKKKDETAEVKEEPKSEQEQSDTQQAADEAVATSTPAAQLHFDEGAGLNWPLQGDVILNYSMDQTIYFATLDQYKYNPAVVIAGKVSDPVSSAAAGKITDISMNEVTGCTVSMDLGDGFTAIYGQLKDVPYQVGDYVESGSTIGFINEQTKYYSLEGSNLYFELQKDGQPVNPVSYFQ